MCAHALSYAKNRHPVVGARAEMGEIDRPWDFRVRSFYLSIRRLHHHLWRLFNRGSLEGKESNGTSGRRYNEKHKINPTRGKNEDIRSHGKK